MDLIDKRENGDDLPLLALLHVVILKGFIPYNFQYYSSIMVLAPSFHVISILLMMLFSDAPLACAE